MSQEDQVKKIICELLPSINEDEITSGSKFKEDLDFDSLDTVEMVMELEEAFNLEITDEDAEKFVTVKDVLDYVAIRGK